MKAVRDDAVSHRQLAFLAAGAGAATWWREAGNNLHAADPNGDPAVSEGLF